MIRSKAIWVIGMQGPEWFEVSEARTTKREADKRCTQLNESLKQKVNKSVRERQSYWACESVNLIEQVPG